MNLMTYASHVNINGQISMQNVSKKDTPTHTKDIKTKSYIVKMRPK